jgi:putative transposase
LPHGVISLLLAFINPALPTVRGNERHRLPPTPPDCAVPPGPIGGFSRPTEPAGGRGPIKTLRQVQRFLAIHDPINSLLPLRRNHLAASEYRAARTQAFDAWAEVTGARLAA